MCAVARYRHSTRYTADLDYIANGVLIYSYQRA